jgi:hypothetical protein
VDTKDYQQRLGYVINEDGVMEYEYDNIEVAKRFSKLGYKLIGQEKVKKRVMRYLILKGGVLVDNPKKFTEKVWCFIISNAEILFAISILYISYWFPSFSSILTVLSAIPILFAAGNKFDVRMKIQMFSEIFFWIINLGLIITKHSLTPSSSDLGEYTSE